MAANGPTRFTMEDLRQLLVEYADVPQGMTVDDPDIALADLDVDSAGMLAVQHALEIRYGIIVRQDEAARLGTTGSAVAYVNQLLSAKQSQAG